MAVHGSFAEARMTAGRPFGGEGLERTGKQSRKGFRLQDSHLVHDGRDGHQSADFGMVLPARGPPPPVWDGQILDALLICRRRHRRCLRP